jgi:hypothetical protein
MDKSDIRKILKLEAENSVLPALSPDFLDDFISYLYKAVDLRSFAQSRPEVKAVYLKRFIVSLPAKKRGKYLPMQYKISFREAEK